MRTISTKLYLAVILFAFFCSLACSLDASAKSKAQTQSALPSYLEPLLQAGSVMGRFGGLGVPSKDYPVFEKALNDKFLKAAPLEKAMKSASPAGKLYAAMILLKRDSKKGKTVLKSLAESSEKVQIQEGCIAQDYTLGKAARELLTKGSLRSIYPPKPFNGQ